jgi:hypothetical protein
MAYLQVASRPSPEGSQILPRKGDAIRRGTPMFTTILRRGGAWRFAALGLLVASIGLVQLTAPEQEAEAHEGSGLCSTVDTPVADFQYTWEYIWEIPHSHYHTWLTGGGLYDHWCYYWYP